MPSSKWKELKIPCPIDGCKSSDGYHIDYAGNGWCFSCSKGTFTNKVTNVVEPLSPSETSLFVGGTHQYLKERGISKATCEFFDLKTDNKRYVFPYYDEKGLLVAQKMRFKDLDAKGKKSYPWKGNNKKAGLFGMNKYHSGHRQS